MPDALWQPVYIVLLFTATFAVICRSLLSFNYALFVCTAVVLLNWTINTFVVVGTGETDATLSFLLTDALSLVLVLIVSGELVVGQMLVSSYVGQILLHGIHISTGSDDLYTWKLLTLIGMGQSIILAIWAAIPCERDAGHELR